MRPYNCDLCVEGPGYETLVLSLSDDLTKLDTNDSENRKTNLTEKLRKAMKRQAKYHNHLRQFETCRDEIRKVQTQLQEGECLVFRDFVNQHNAEGKKINNLVIVIMYREKNGNPLQTDKPAAVT